MAEGAACASPSFLVLTNPSLELPLYVIGSKLIQVSSPFTIKVNLIDFRFRPSKSAGFVFGKEHLGLAHCISGVLALFSLPAA